MSHEKTQQPLPLEKWAEYPELKLNPEQPERMVVREEDLERFWSKVKKGTPNECWVWMGSISGRGYGEIRFRGRAIKAHRFSIYLKGTEVPPLMQVCHTCDNPPCVNPNHLFVGSKSDNMRDAMSKGRLTQSASFYLRRPNSRRYHCGESNTSHILSDEDVIKIRESRDGLTKLSAVFGVSKNTIWRVRTNQRGTSRTWLKK